MQRRDSNRPFRGRDRRPVGRGSGTAISQAAIRQRQAARKGPPPFAAADILDAAALVARLTRHADLLAEYLWNRFSATSRQTLSSPAGADAQAVLKILVDEFNGIAQGELIYEKQRFAPITFCKETRILLVQRPRGDRLVRLNRSLLVDAFPAELRRVGRPADMRDTVYRAEKRPSGTKGKRKLSIRQRLLQLAAMVVVLLLLLAVAKPVYRVYRQWAAERSLDQANGFLAKTDYRNAALAARKVLGYQPNNIGATRIMAHLAELAGLPEAIKWRQRMVELEPTIVTNRLALARTALELRNPLLAQLTLENIAETNRNTSAFHQLWAMLELNKGRIKEAAQHLAIATRLEPDNPVLRLNLAAVHLQSETPAEVAAAQKTLLALSEEAGTRRGALQHLVKFAADQKDFARAQQFSEKLVADPGAAFEDRLLHLSVLEGTQAPSLTNYLATVRSEAEQRPERIQTFTAWLVGHNRTAEALSWLTALPEATTQQQPVMLAISDCYIAQKDWARLDEYLKGKKWEHQEFLRLALLAGTASKQKDEVKAKSLWQSAVVEGTGSLRALQALARMAQDWRWAKERDEVLWLIVERFPMESQALQALEEAYVSNGNTRGLNKLYTYLVDSGVKEVSESMKFLFAKNNLASTLLLLKNQLNRAHEFAKDVYRAHPENPAFAATYAYSEHVQGNTQAGLQALEKLKPAMLEIPAIATYYGVLLAANGDAAKAGKYLELARTARLLPEEQALVTNALAKVQSR